jgi:hypothetical protein
MHYKILKTHFSKSVADRADILLQLLRLDPSLDKEYVDLGLLYRSGHISPLEMTEISVCRLEHFPNDVSLWRILSYALSGVFKSLEAPGPIIESLQEPWKLKLHWIKNNCMSEASLSTYSESS